MGVVLGVDALGVERMGKLSAVMVKSLNFPGDKVRPVRFGDGDGLYLQIAPGNSKSWLFRYSLRGKAREMGLGPYDSESGKISLADARKCAGAAREKLRAGVDPIADRQTERNARARAEAEDAERTFRAAATVLVASKRSGWRNAKHASQWLATLETHAFPVIGDLPVALITTDHVLKVLSPIWDRIPETASRLRQRVEAVLDSASVNGWRSGENPARWRGHLAAHLPQPRKVKRVRHRPALSWQEMGAFMAALAEREGISAQALRFTILTAARTGEVRGMRWRELDLDAKVWTVPGDRMKAGRLHRVPLSPAAVAILAQVRPLMRTPTDLVFPSVRNNVELSDVALSSVLRRMNEGSEHDAPPRWRDAEGRAVVPHGFRSTFRDWAGETRSEGREVVEAALAHTVRDKSEAAYARSDLLEKRRPLMDAWAEQCARLPAEVVVPSTWERRAAAQ
jgi:integrase